MAKDLLDGEFMTTQIDPIALGGGFIAAFLTGLAACTWMISLVKKSKLSWFSIYCFLVGAAAIIWSLAT